MLAHIVLKERLNIFGIVGCILCIVGSMTIVLHAPEEQPITSLLQVWRLALQPGKFFLRAHFANAYAMPHPVCKAVHCCWHL